MEAMSNMIARVGIGSVALGLASVGGQAMVFAGPAIAQEPATTGNDATGAVDETPAEVAADESSVAAVASCPSGKVCVWENDNYQGLMYTFTPPNQDGDYTNGSPTWKGTEMSLNDRISSYQNASNTWVRFYQNKTSETGNRYFCAGPGASSPDLFNFQGPAQWNPEDSFSAHTTHSIEPSTCSYRDVD